MPASGAGKGATPGAGWSALEAAVLIVVVLYLTAATWGFGGNSPGMRLAICGLGTVGAVLTGAIFFSRPESRPAFTWLWPFLLLNALVLASLFNPNVRELNFGGETMYARTGGTPNLPSTADAGASLRSLWLFDGIYLSCFNVVLAVSRRKHLRWLLLFAAGNAVTLAVFGTVQKLSQSRGLYFGAVEAPQPAFFASFVYHNHWGAFAVLLTAVALGLARFYADRRQYRDFLHSPAPTALLAGFLVAASIPLSTSRSTTILVLLLLLGATGDWVARTWRRFSTEGRSPVVPLVLGLTVLAVALGAGYKLAQPVIESRLATTRSQVADLRQRGNFGARQQLYRDTWRMAQDKLPFGWGMGSYPRIFFTYNTQDRAVDGFTIFYEDAHSDWLQAIAETGLVGLATIACLGLVPLWKTRRQGGWNPLPAYLLAGCALILLYAWIEFPFGNPAVVFCWWFCFFIALQYRRLSGSPAVGPSGGFQSNRPTAR